MAHNLGPFHETDKYSYAQKCTNDVRVHDCTTSLDMRFFTLSMFRSMWNTVQSDSMAAWLMHAENKK